MMKKIMTNAEIYGLCKALNLAFNNEERYMPAKVNFYIQKNKNTLAQINDSIELTRQDIIAHYGTLDSENQKYVFNQEVIDQVNKELQDLLNVEIEVEISMLQLSDLENLEFTSKQMQALLFMIKED